MSTEIVGKIAKGPSGRHLGRVVELQAGRFSVEVNESTVWLPLDTVFSVDDGEVTVIFEPSAVSRYALKGGGELTA